jgi:hypothetical protein
LSLLRRLLIRNMMLTRQLELLAECGIRPAEGIGLNELLSRHRETEYERSPFTKLLRVLGGAPEGDPQRWWSDNIWLLNIESIGGPGDYVQIARRMASLAGEALPVADLKDGIDPGQDVAWLEFKLEGSLNQWHAKIEENWIDSRIVSNFVKLLESRDTDKRFTYLDLPGKECLIGCATPEEFAKLRKWTGLEFEWLG